MNAMSLYNRTPSLALTAGFLISLLAIWSVLPSRSFALEQPFWQYKHSGRRSHQAGQVAPPATRSGLIPTGVFNLAKVGRPAAAAVFSNPNVDGISIRQAWRELETSEGHYDWSYLDSEVGRAERAGKTVLLRIISEGPATPRWVFESGVRKFTFEDRNRYHGVKGPQAIAVYWDPTYVKYKQSLIRNLGQHFATHSAVRIVAAVCASSHSGDWAVPHTPVDIRHWHEIGYTSDKLINVCKQTIDATMQSFPNQLAILAVGRNGKLDRDPNYVARETVNYARTYYPGRLIVEKNSLAASTPPPSAPRLKHFELLWQSRPDIAAQMLWFSYGDPTCRNNGRMTPCNPAATLRKAIDIGKAYGVNFIEIYQEDVLHLPDDVSYAHSILGK